MDSIVGSEAWPVRSRDGRPLALITRWHSPLRKSFELHVSPYADGGSIVSAKALAATDDVRAIHAVLRLLGVAIVQHEKKE